LREHMDLQAASGADPGAGEVATAGEGSGAATVATNAAAPAAAAPAADNKTAANDDETPRGRATRRAVEDEADGEAESASAEESEEDEEEEESNVSLAAMEAALLPSVLETFDQIADTWKKLSKIQDKRLAALQKGEKISSQQEKRYEKLRSEMVQL